MSAEKVAHLHVAEPMPNELSREQFIAHLIKAGWRQDEAEAEWDAIQDDEESGYDGP